MIDLAPINKQLEVFSLMSVEEFCALYNQRFKDAPDMQSALKEWQVDYLPVRLEQTVRQRLPRPIIPTCQELPETLDDILAFLESDDRRVARLAELDKMRLTNQISDWCYVYSLRIRM